MAVVSTPRSLLCHLTVVQGHPAPFGSVSPKASRLVRPHLCYPVLIAPGVCSQGWFCRGLALARMTMVCHFLAAPKHSVLLVWVEEASRQTRGCMASSFARQGTISLESPLAHCHSTTWHSRVFPHHADTPQPSSGTVGSEDSALPPCPPRAHREQAGHDCCPEHLQLGTSQQDRSHCVTWDNFPAMARLPEEAAANSTCVLAGQWLLVRTRQSMTPRGMRPAA